MFDWILHKPEVRSCELSYADCVYLFYLVVCVFFENVLTVEAGLMEGFVLLVPHIPCHVPQFFNELGGPSSA